MSTGKHIDIVCLAAALAAVLLMLVFVNGEALGIEKTETVMGYETRLFDNSQVHSLDIVMEDWDAFLETCEDEEYSSCTVVIDGEKYSTVAIRGKGNTSLSSVSQSGSDRYSFKLEFDHYDSSSTYYGLDKLCLNNTIQDATYMKDYLCYTMMDEFGVDAPLCSFVYITVNGEDWGLYLAVEGVEDSFLQRNYGSGDGDLYKPDGVGGGGGGGGGFDFGDMEMPDFGDFEMPDFSGFEAPTNDSGDSSADENADENAGESVNESADEAEAPGEAPAAAPEQSGDSTDDSTESEAGFPEMPGGFGGGSEDGDFSAPDFDGGGFGMGSDDTKLQYIDDDPDSYSDIFNSAKTEVTEEDQQRLISSLQQLSSYEDLEQVLDIDEVIRYFVVHNYVVNGDSYTGSMIHNYYLYEEDGKFSMIPWDYNLAFGTFQGSDAESSINDPIDDVLEDRPMQAWIFSDEKYTELYHQYYREFLETVDIQSIISSAAELIAPYVEKDPTAFFEYDEFQTAIESLKTFCTLRSESVSGQLDGTIPSTEDGQKEDSSALIEANGLSTSDMGSMGGGGGGGGGGPDFGGGSEDGGFSPLDFSGGQDGGFTPPGSDAETETTTSTSEASDAPAATTDAAPQEAPTGEAPENAAPAEMPAGGFGGGSEDSAEADDAETADGNGDNADSSMPASPEGFGGGSEDSTGSGDGAAAPQMPGSSAGASSDNGDSSTESQASDIKPDSGQRGSQHGGGQPDNGLDFGGGSTPDSQQEETGSSMSAEALTAVTLLVLLAGLAIALIYKR